MESDLSRREFLERTALAAGVAGAPRCRPRRSSPSGQATAKGNPLPSPRNIPIDHFVILMMENRSFDHYFGWLREADGEQTQSYPNASPAAGADAPFLDARHRRLQYKGCGHPDPGHGWDSGRAQLNGGFLAPGLGQRRVRAHLLQPGRPRLHPRGGAQLHHLRPLLLLAARLDLAEPLLQVVGPVGRAEEQHRSPRRQQLGDDLRPRDQQGPERSLLRLRPALRRAVRRRARARGSTRSRATTPTAPRHAAEHRDRRPAVHGRRRRRRPVGRRAPARRRAAGPGVQVGRGQRVRQVDPTTAAARCS